MASGSKLFFKVKSDGTIDQPCPEGVFPVKENDFVAQNINAESVVMQVVPTIDIAHEAQNPEIVFEKDINIAKVCPASN